MPALSGMGLWQRRPRPCPEPARAGAFFYPRFCVPKILAFRLRCAIMDVRERQSNRALTRRVAATGPHERREPCRN